MPGTMPAAKVLIVDDDAVFRTTTARILDSHGYSSRQASSVAAAEDILDNEPDIDVALCDIMMPDASGLELLAEVSSRFPDVAMVMTTAVDDPEVAEETFQLGAVGYITKPFESNALLIHLSCALRRRDLDRARRQHVLSLEASLASRPVDTPTRVKDSSEKIRVLIVDDHVIFTESLIRVLGSRPELTVVGTAGTVHSAVAAAVELRPDVVLMDFELPDGDGPQATAHIKALMPSVHVIMLTALAGGDALVRAIAAGCSGFVNKGDAVDDLVQAILAARDNEPINPTPTLTPLLRQLPPTERGLGADLTLREREVLELMSAGLINKQVAKRLGLRLNTVRNHSQNILYKLRAHSRLEAVATALRDGLIAYPDQPANR
jgi:DNA-binding NarL/FixJ family response regulator